MRTCTRSSSKLSKDSVFKSLSPRRKRRSTRVHKKKIMDKEDAQKPDDNSPSPPNQTAGLSSPTSPRDDDQFQGYFLQPHPAPLMPPPFLSSLKPEGVISFPHRFHDADAAVSIMIRKLKEAKGDSTSAEILKELDVIVEDYDRSKKDYALHTLDSKLAWDLTEPTEEIRINAYMDSVLEIMNVDDLKNGKKMETKAVKLVLKDLSIKHKLEPSDYDRLKSLFANARAKILSPDEIELLEAKERNINGKGGTPTTHEKINNLKKLLIYKTSVFRDTKR
eukprot:augustus_masked-scaffold_10-processed-gene-5.52-mRNA-1 protein AED:1.00 eAED:1.00 QI:0/0/0/0/1/1/2/0/277